MLLCKMMNLNYLMDHILYLLFEIILSMLLKKRMTDNKIRMYANKTESKITFKIKARSYLELLTPETIKLIGGITIKMTEEKNGKNIPYL